MAARQSFEQSQRASQIGVGHGEAQVTTVGDQGMGDIAQSLLAAQKQRDKKKKDKEDELKIDDAGDVLPIYQTMLGKENASLYAWGKEHQDDPDFDVKWNQKKMEHGAKIAEAREESKRFRTLQGKYDPNKNYNEDSLRSADLSMDYQSVLDDQGNLVFDWEEGSDVVKDANKGYSQGYASKGFKEVADIMRPQVNFSKEKNKYEFINDKGEQIMTSTEDFTEDQARNLILNNMKTMDNDFYQSGLNQMDDSDKKKYGEDMNGVAEWYADEYADEFVQEYNQRSITPSPKDKSGDGELDTAMKNIVRRIQNLDHNAMKALVGSNYLGSSVADIKASSTGIKVRLANGDVHQIDTSDSASFNEFMNALSGMDVKKRQQLIDLSNQEYAGDTDWKKLNEDIKIIQDAYDEPDKAKSKLKEIGMTEIEVDDGVITFKDKSGASREINASYDYYKDKLEGTEGVDKVTEEMVHDFMYQSVKEEITRLSRENYIVPNTGENTQGNKSTASGGGAPSGGTSR